ncbi:ATP-binding protein [Streptomyces zhihengii]|uniref:ATP-binding protein n=1 Tax=Streptomyces zhihengii TaxID=1818004 RepID=UPI0033B3DC0B
MNGTLPQRSNGLTKDDFPAAERARGGLLGIEGCPAGDGSVSVCPARDFQVAMVVPAQADAVFGARRQLACLLRSSGLAECADTVLLVAQELMVNAMVHGCASRPDGRFVMRAKHWRGCLRVEVEDPSTEQPRPRTATADEEAGRGLQLLDALVTRWGVDLSLPDETSKTVWFELDPAAGEAAS